MIGVYAGRFDPPTNGHASGELFEEWVVAVYDLPPERCLCSTEERVAMLKASMPDDVPISVERFSGLLTDFVRSRGRTRSYVACGRPQATVWKCSTISPRGWGHFGLASNRCDEIVACRG